MKNRKFLQYRRSMSAWGRVGGTNVGGTNVGGTFGGCGKGCHVSWCFVCVLAIIVVECWRRNKQMMQICFIDIALHEPTLYILTAFCRQKIINCASYILKTSYIKSISNSTQYPHDMKKYRWYTYWTRRVAAFLESKHLLQYFIVFSLQQIVLEYQVRVPSNHSFRMLVHFSYIILWTPRTVIVGCCGWRFYSWHQYQCNVVVTATRKICNALRCCDLTVIEFIHITSFEHTTTMIWESTSLGRSPTISCQKQRSNFFNTSNTTICTLEILCYLPLNAPPSIGIPTLSKAR